MLWLYLHFPSLQLDSLYQTDNALPVAIVHGRKSDVVQRNENAKKSGIKIGMGLGSAAALCPDLQVLAYDEKQETAKLTHIAQWLYLVTADISLYPPNGLLLRVSHMLSLYQGLDNYWQVLTKHLQRLNLRYEYGCGYSPYAAKLLAMSASNQLNDNKQQIDNLLGSMPLQVTDLTKKVVNHLGRVGVQSIGDLLRLPLTDIAKRFDIELVTYIGRLTGQLRHPVDFYHPPETFKHYLELMFEISNLQYLQKPLFKVFHLLEQFLRFRDKHAGQLNIELHLRDSESVHFQVHSAEGEYQAKRWLNLSQLTLESIKVSAPVIAITVEAMQIRGNDFRVMDMFSKHCGAISANELVSRLQAKLGKGRVQGVTQVDDHRPELSTIPCPPLQKHSTIKPTKTSATVLQPSFILPQPLPVQEKMNIQHGPERIVAGWWDKHPVTRDYFIARNSKGQWLWIFRTSGQSWFVHGLFS
ncbi:DNA polymerase Y family protein [Thalassotalea litorea]|uniref:DNA polymerase Y family protein n=1 Tax=Thalassotalea litorea TaxID=2020715 RepID=A0A5R9IH28_9GAMM|nr:DNA polymerase Y family protein [Thalassotalea litorea]TLU64815.1 DNA polymerase Y family protein [Thalassotalea litorea]